MSSILKAADLTREQLIALLDTLPDDGSLRCWLEGVDGWALAWWRGLKGELSWSGANRLPETTTAADKLPYITGGRIFSSQGELKWRVLPALGEKSHRTVFLGDVDWGGDALDMIHDNMDDHFERLNAQDQYLLWGQQTKDTDSEWLEPRTWIELRIPHRFHFPVNTTDNLGVQVTVENWSDAEGVLQFVRLRELTPYSEK